MFGLKRLDAIDRPPAPGNTESLTDGSARRAVMPSNDDSVPPAFVSRGEDEANGPYAVRVLGYVVLTASLTGIVWAISSVWVREDVSKVIAMLSWGGSLSPLILTALTGPAAALILAGRWLRRTGHRK